MVRQLRLSSSAVAPPTPVQIQRVVCKATFGQEVSMPLSMARFLMRLVRSEATFTLVPRGKPFGGEFVMPMICWINPNLSLSIGAVNRIHAPPHQQLHARKVILSRRSWGDLSSSMPTRRHRPRARRLLQTVAPAAAQLSEGQLAEVLVPLSLLESSSSSSAAGGSETSKSSMSKLERLLRHR